jgi:pentapeptide MXKDX repeat protein
VMWCDVMWCDVMWCDVMWCDVMWCDVMWCDVMRWDEMRWDEMRWDVMWCDVMCCDEMRWDEMRWDVGRTEGTYGWMEVGVRVENGCGKVRVMGRYGGQCLHKPSIYRGWWGDTEVNAYINLAYTYIYQYSYVSLSLSLVRNVTYDRVFSVPNAWRAT